MRNKTKPCRGCGFISITEEKIGNEIVCKNNVKRCLAYVTVTEAVEAENGYKNQPNSTGTWKRAGDPKEYVVHGEGCNNLGGYEYLVMLHPEMLEPPRRLEDVTFVSVGKGPEWYKVSDDGEVTPDPVNHPPHYKAHPSGIECIQITEHMDFLKGNAIKYIWRAGSKGSEIEDLEKAVWYLERRIAMLSAPCQ